MIYLGFKGGRHHSLCLELYSQSSVHSVRTNMQGPQPLRLRAAHDTLRCNPIAVPGYEYRILGPLLVSPE